MPDLQYFVRHYGGLWHWEVRTERGDQLGHGATLTRAAATAEAMIYATHPARVVEIDTVELARSAERAETSHRASADAKQRRRVANLWVNKLTWLHDRGGTLMSVSCEAIAESRRLLAIPPVKQVPAD